MKSETDSHPEIGNRKSEIGNDARGDRGLNPWCARCSLLGPNIGECKWPDCGTRRPGCYARPVDAAGTCDPETGEIVATDRIGCHEGRPPAADEPDPEGVRREGLPQLRPDSPEQWVAREPGRGE